MIFDQEFIILTILVFSLTAAAWVYTHGVAFNLADLTTIQKNPNQPIRRSAIAPLLLPSTPPVTAPVAEKAELQSAGLAVGSTPLDQHTQLDRIAGILQTAIELAGKAERLHNAAHEQLDGAHYALQNLLDELSAVMPVSAPAKGNHDAPAAYVHQPRRQTYVTALAA
ncbi:MAG: hypothetical protein ABL901_16575 [Hyphomicrobiaceae bacterium]